MLKNKFKISASVLLVIAVSGLTGCSAFSQVGKSARNLTGGGSNQVAGVDEKLIIPPSLKQPTNTSVSRSAPKAAPAQARQAQPRQAQPRRQPQRAVSKPDGEFYIIVGTYPDQLDALDMFTRLSSIGLKAAAMESRRTKTGSLLHMVRLGPYSKQEDIDEAKESLTNTGLSTFKVVKS